ncbi:YhdP family protein [Salinimonas iocasae]|uniref:TIGR02099 family protein n=1 Tax=Salinimonas iocasae TaxID=2572577 RepID=A0A5B7YA06_9ALTE|nr:YhdP family protein [Salinimonas iocasae]QCZ92166.1 TIGR02099 family protein [Salinimonas iocasae]
MGKKREIAGKAVTWTAKKLWLGLAVFLVLFAVLLSVLRYSLPYLDNKKPLLEEYINQQYGVALSIGTLKADWLQSGPSIVLEDVKLQSNAQSPIAMDIDNIDIELNFWQSLTTGQLSSKQFNLDGVALIVDTTRLNSDEQPSDYPVIDALHDLFLEQLERFSLRDGVVTLLKEDTEQVIEVSELSWLNRNGQHRGAGAFRVQELASNAATFLIDLDGGKDNLRGTLYAQAEDVDISPWVSGKLQTRRPLKESRANLEAWAEVENSKISAVFTQIHDSRLTWGGQDNVTVSTGILGGSFQALPKNDHWYFRIDQLEVVSNKQRLVTDLVGRWSQGDGLLINTVKPTPVNPFLVLLPLFTDDTADDDVRDFAPTGQLATLQMKAGQAGLAVTAKLLDVSWQQHDGIPGLQQLDIDINWNNSQGAVRVQSRDAMLLTDTLLPENIGLNQLDANIYIYPLQTNGQQNWMLSYDDLILDTAVAKVTQSLRLNLSDADLSLFTTVSDMPVDSAKKLFPATLMGKNTADYLTRALTGKGEVANTRILWHGKPGNFPFSDNSGVFQAYTFLQESAFDFSKQWPALDDMNMALEFENNGLVMKAPAATLAGIQLSDLEASIIPLSGTANLNIAATGNGTGEQLSALMMQSSLSESLGNVLSEEVQISGPVSTNLTLTIPLDSANVVAKGTASLNGNVVKLPRLNMTLNDARGDIAFLNENINTESMQASLLGQPLSLAVTGGKKDDGYGVDIGAKGHWDLGALSSRFSDKLGGYLSGDSDWQANVSVQLPAEGFTYTASITSTLENTQSGLPAPFDKPADTVKRFAISSVGDAKASTIKALLGDDIAFDGILPHQEMQFSRAHLALGKSDFTGRGIGLSVSANLPRIDAGSWYSVIDELISEQTDTEDEQPALFAVPQRLFIMTDELIVAGQTLTNVDITAKQNSNNWLLDIDTKQARANVSIYEDFLKRGIRVEADYINLPEWTTPEPSEEATSVKWSAESLPPVYAFCQQCTLLGNALGQVTLDVVRGDNGMVIRQLSTSNKHTQINATGNWNTQTQTTTLTGTLQSDDVGRMLQDLNVNSGIKDSAASIAFSLDWPESPMDFSVEQLNGDINWRLTDGYLSELSDKGSRIFTLFSLNSLVRKLSLDFRDVFAKGFFYDDMSGTLSIADGRATTDDTVIDGGAGEITIKGVTNLAAQKLNYDVSFTPNVTGNLPVLVYFLASPPTALAALAIDQVLTSAKVISNVNYKVRGTWDNPEFTEVGRDSKEVTLPARQKNKNEKPTPLSKPDLERLNLEVQDG